MEGCGAAIPIVLHAKCPALEAVFILVVQAGDTVTRSELLFDDTKIKDDYLWAVYV